MKQDVGIEKGEEKEKRWREREREVFRLLYEADLDRRGLDTLHLWRDTVTAAVDVCVCVHACLCMFTAEYMMCSFALFKVLKCLQIL